MAQPTVIVGKYEITGLIVLGLFFHGCATAPKVKVPTAEVLLKDLCRDNNINWSWDSINQVVTLSRQGPTAKAMVGSNLVIIGEDRIILDAPLRRYQGVVSVPLDFKVKVIDKLVQKEYAILKFKKVVIDPGHGGKDPGAIGKVGLKEKTIVLDIAQRLRKDLAEKGIEVAMTREGDEFVPLEERARLANKSKADLFISIHANSSRARSVHGFEVFYLRNLDDAVRKDIQSATNYKEMFNQFSMKHDRPALEKILLDMLYIHKQYESKKLAGYLTKNTTDTINSMDRGSKTAGFSVLRNTLIPAVLIEVGFLSNKNEESLLATNSYRQEIADSLAKSIIQYANQQ